MIYSDIIKTRMEQHVTQLGYTVEAMERPHAFGAKNNVTFCQLKLKSKHKRDLSFVTQCLKQLEA